MASTEESNPAQMEESTRIGSLPEAGSGEGHFDAIPTVTWALADLSEAQGLGNARFSTTKRRLSSTGDHDTPKRRHVSSGTPSPGAFADLKIAKPILLDQGETTTKYYVPSSISSQTVNPLSPQTIGPLSSQTLDDPSSLVAHGYGGRNTAARLEQKTTMNHLTPRLTESSQYSIWGMHEVLGAGSFAAPPASVDTAEQNGRQGKDAPVQPNMQDDEYPVDDDDEEDMLRLFNDVKPVSNPQLPPSSVANAWDHDSRTAEEYDPRLQHSSVLSTPDSGIELQQSKSQNGTEEDLLDDDVDWDTVFAVTSAISKDDSLVGDRELEQRRKEATANDETRERLAESLPDLARARPLSPFTRPPFPTKVRDRPSVLGLSSSAVLRVCFRVEALIQEATRCYHYGQNAIFELYARVTYSSRESLEKKQCFQFRDLFEDKQPFPSGTLSNWRPGSLLDQQSQVFLGTRTPQLCWVLSKPRREPKSSAGLTLDIISIRQTDWDQVRFAKAIACG